MLWLKTYHFNNEMAKKISLMTYEFRFFFLLLYELQMVLCTQLCLSIQPARWWLSVHPASWPYISPFWMAKFFNIEHYVKTFQPSSFILAMLIGTIDFYHFILQSLTLTLPLMICVYVCGCVCVKRTTKGIAGPPIQVVFAFCLDSQYLLCTQR